MICPECGVETRGWNHNNRGLKCTNCMAPLPTEAVEEKPEVEAVAEVEVEDTPETKGWNHNNRGLKCTNCMAPLPTEAVEEKPEVEAVAEVEVEDTPKPKRKRSSSK